MANYITKKMGPVDLTIPAERIASLFIASPDHAFHWARDAFGRMFGRWRKHFLDVQKSSGMKKFACRSVFYTVYPTPGKGHRSESLDDILGVVWHTSKIPYIHEVGRRIRAKQRLMPIPLTKTAARLLRGKGVSGIQQFMKGMKAAGKRIVILPMKSKRGYVLYRDDTRKRKTRSRRGSGRRRRRLTPLVAFKKQVKLKATLGAESSWKSMAGDRQNLMREAAKKTVRDIAQGRPPKTRFRKGNTSFKVRQFARRLVA